MYCTKYVPRFFSTYGTSWWYINMRTYRLPGKECGDSMANELKLPQSWARSSIKYWCSRHVQASWDSYTYVNFFYRIFPNQGTPCLGTALFCLFRPDRNLFVSYSLEINTLNISQCAYNTFGYCTTQWLAMPLRVRDIHGSAFVLPTHQNTRHNKTCRPTNDISIEFEIRSKFGAL